MHVFDLLDQWFVLFSSWCFAFASALVEFEHYFCLSIEHFIQEFPLEMHRLFHLRKSIAPFNYSFFVRFYFLLKCRNLCLPHQEAMNYMRSRFFIQLQAHWNSDCEDVANLSTLSLKQVFAPCAMHALNYFLYLRNTFPLFLIQGYLFEFVLESLGNLSDHLVFL